MQLKYSTRDAPTIKQFMASDAFIRGLQGPFGSGKSAACAVEIAKRGVAQKPGNDGVRRSRWAVIRNSYRQLNDTTIKTFHQWFPPYVMGEWRPSEDRYIIKALRAADNEPNAEIEVLFRALDRPDQVGNLLSLELTGGWVNEAREVPWAVIEALQGRVTRYPAMKDGGASWCGIIMDTNPPDTDSKWYKFFEEQDHSEAIAEMAKVVPGFNADKYARIFKQPSGLAQNAENIPNLRPGYYQQLAIGKSPEWVKVYIHGQYGFTVDGKPVFPEYNDTLHCPSEPEKMPRTDPKLPVYRGWDFGLTPACTFSQITTSGQWVVVDELVSDSMGVDRFSDEALEHSARHFPGTEFIDVGDPAGAQRAQTDEKTCFQILWAKGIQIEPGLQDPTIRQECVRKPLRTLASGKPQFVLHPRCKMLRKGFMGAYAYRRMQTSGERYTSTPDKNEASHCFPAGVMVSTPNGPRPIEALRCGDIVCTPVGDREVTAVISSLAADFVDLDLANGASVRCTTDHKIASSSGFFVADALQYTDRIVVERDECQSSQFTQSRSLRGDHITKSLRGIFRRAMTVAASICTAPFGSLSMARYLRVFRSTIRTTTSRIMTSPILNWFPPQTTPLTTASIAGSASLSRPSVTWQSSDHSPARGIVRQKDWLGIASTVFGALLPFRSRRTNALSAASHTRSSAAAESADSAAWPANKSSGVEAASTTRPDPARSAIPHSLSTDILRREPAADLVSKSYVAVTEPVRVYDLTVADAHCFYANGILVSNCHDSLQYVATRLFAAGLRAPRSQPDDDYEPALLDRTRSGITGY